MYNHNKAQQSKNRVHISWDILYIEPYPATWQFVGHHCVCRWHLMVLGRQQVQCWIQTRISYVLIISIIRNSPLGLTINYQSRLAVTLTRLRLHRFLALCLCGREMGTPQLGRQTGVLSTWTSLFCRVPHSGSMSPIIQGRWAGVSKVIEIELKKDKW